jgi:hypothetical protein
MEPPPPLTKIDTTNSSKCKSEHPKDNYFSCFRCLVTDSEDIAAIAVKILTNYLTNKSPQQRRINLVSDATHLKLLD